MKSSGSSFELIMQELLNQKQVLEDMEAENRELRRQLAELREGRGIFVDILGQRYSLAGDFAVVSLAADSTQQNDLTKQDTSTATNEAAMSSIPETPLPNTDAVEEVLEEVASQSSVASPTPTFLEEMLLDEFSSATTSQMAVWPGPAPKSSIIDEAEKATLRRELMGSFLLE